MELHPDWSFPPQAPPLIFWPVLIHRFQDRYVYQVFFVFWFLFFCVCSLIFLNILCIILKQKIANETTAVASDDDEFEEVESVLRSKLRGFCSTLQESAQKVTLQKNYFSRKIRNGFRDGVPNLKCDSRFVFYAAKNFYIPHFTKTDKYLAWISHSKSSEIGGGAPNLKSDSRFVFCVPKIPHIPDFNNLTANLNFGTLELHFIPLCSGAVSQFTRGLQNIVGIQQPPCCFAVHPMKSFTCEQCHMIGYIPSGT